MRTGITRQVADSHGFEIVETTLMEIMADLQAAGFCDEQIVEEVQRRIDRRELHLIGQFRDEDLVVPRAA